MDPTGTIVFSTIGIAQYGFDVFSVKLPSSLNSGDILPSSELCLTDGISISFNVQFVDDEGTIVYISEKTGSPRIYLSRTGAQQPEKLHSPPESLFHDRPVIRNGRLYFISAHEQPHKPFQSWSALYSTGIDDKKIQRLTPADTVDYSPSISPSGKLIAVSSYGSRTWGGEFRDLETDIVVIKESDPNIRATVCKHGGWPTWSDESTIYFHRQAEDGWWSIYRVDLPRGFDFAESHYPSCRVTPPGLHCFTPAASLTDKKLAVATRRRDKSHRHIEIFDTEAEKFYPVTELLHPNFHFYNPAFSPNSTILGYHRFRGESSRGESTIPYLTPVDSPIERLKMFRLNGFFPSFSPSGDLIAYNQDFSEKYSGIKVVKSDGSRRWVLFKNRTTFYNSWSPTEQNVIFTTIGPIFESPKTTVQIARVSFDLTNLTEDSEVIKSNIKYLTDEGTGNNAFPSCSPDGKFIVFRSGRSGHKNLYIIDAVNGEFSGGSIRRLTEGPWIDTMPSWSPDGKLIAFSSNMHNPKNTEAFSIYVINPDGSGLRRIHLDGVDVDVANRERLNHVCWSADCNWFLFAANLGGVTAEPVSLPNQFQPYGDLYLVRVDGSRLRRLTWNGYENGTPAWHSNSSCFDVNLESLSLNTLNKGATGDKLIGEFIEPLWLHCDI